MLEGEIGETAFQFYHIFNSAAACEFAINTSCMLESKGELLKIPERSQTRKASNLTVSYTEKEMWQNKEEDNMRTSIEKICLVLRKDVGGDDIW